MIVENREGRPEDALERLAYMQQQHPGNRLLWLNRGATALAAHRPREADQILTDGFVRHDLQAAPAVLGEKALWLAHRGTARAALHHDAAATDDLLRGLLQIRGTG